jgi:hypothetical protein
LLLAVCWQVAAHRHRGTGTTALSPGRPRPRTNAPLVHCSPQLDFEGTAQGNERKADEAVLVRRAKRANDNPAPAVLHWVAVGDEPSAAVGVLGAGRPPSIM